jgi:hypothetical protein
VVDEHPGPAGGTAALGVELEHPDLVVAGSERDRCDLRVDVVVQQRERAAGHPLPVPAQADVLLPVGRLPGLAVGRVARGQLVAGLGDREDELPAGEHHLESVTLDA